MAKLRRVFSRIKISGMELGNRVVFAPMRSHFGTPECHFNDRQINYIKARAKGGAGLIIVEDVVIDPRGRQHHLMQSTTDDSCIPVFKRVCDAVHEFGSKVSVEITHAGRETTTKLTGLELVAPSPIPSPIFKEEPRELTLDEIKKVVGKFGDGARRIKEAGADGVHLMIGFGHLVGQFLSPFTNQRQDEYGGDLNGRIRFAREVITEIRKQVGDDYPLSARISGDEFVEGGLNLDDMKVIAPMLADAGIDAFDVVGGIIASVTKMIPDKSSEEGCYIYLAEGIKKAVNVPVGVGGRIVDLQMAEDAIDKGKADFVVLGRALLADPELPNKSRRGKFDKIVKCNGCNACTDLVLRDEPIACPLNPKLGYEK